MWKEALIAAGISTALVAAPALAQQETQEGQTEMQQQQQGQQAQPEQQAQPDPDQQAQPGQQAEYQGWPVFTADGQKIGEVVEVQPGDAGQGEKLLVESGGFFGIGSKTVEISDEQYSAGQDRIELSMTADQAQDLPEAEREGS